MAPGVARALALAACTLLLAACASTGVRTPTHARIQQHFRALAQVGDFNGVVFYQQGAQRPYIEAFNLHGLPERLRAHTGDAFHIASLSKLFVAAAFIELQRRGRVEFDDPVASYLPDFPNGERITLRHLLAHRSGLPRGDPDAYDRRGTYAIDETYRLIARQELQFEPGRDQLYSNFGYRLLHVILHRFHPEGMDAALRELVFAPLNMTATFEYTRAGARRALAPGFHHVDDQPRAVPERHYQHFATGNYFSTARDLLRFARRNDYDWLYRQDHTMSHSGALPGVRAMLTHDRRRRVIYGFLSNLDRTPSARIGRSLARLVAGQRVPRPQPLQRTVVSLPVATLARYQGVYRLRVNNRAFVIRLENGRLYRYDRTDGRLDNRERLYPQDEDSFFLDPQSYETVHFIPDAGGGYRMVLEIRGGLRLDADRIGQ